MSSARPSPTGSAGPPAASETGGASTRERLIGAAEDLFATHGIAGVSLREINRVAGAKGAVALQYHFHDRNGLLRAILAKHDVMIEARRHALLDQYESRGVDDVAALADALVRPAAAKLSDPTGGPQFLQIYAELVNRPRPRVDAAPGDPADSLQRWRALVEPLLDPIATRLHRRFTAIRFTAVELGRRAATAPHTDDRLFVNQLVDLVAALLVAPVSAETHRLAADRDAS